MENSITSILDFRNYYDGSKLSDTAISFLELCEDDLNTCYNFLEHILNRKFLLGTITDSENLKVFYALNNLCKKISIIECPIYSFYYDYDCIGFRDILLKFLFLVLKIQLNHLKESSIVFSNIYFKDIFDFLREHLPHHKKDIDTIKEEYLTKYDRFTFGNRLYIASYFR